MSYFYFLILYIAISYATMRIARRLDAKWLALLSWLPLGREILVVKLARKKWWWVLLLLVPFINIWPSWVIWGTLARRLGRSAWWGRAMIVPFFNVFLLLILAFEWKPRTWPPIIIAWLKKRFKKDQPAPLPDAINQA
jgi:hypothetical protein